MSAWAVMPLVVFACWRRRGELFFRYVMIATPIYLAYVAKIGGDFMLGRLLIPLTPLLVVAAEAGAREALTRRWWPVGALGILLAGLVVMPVHLIAPRKERWYIAEEQTYYPLQSFAPVVVDSDLYRYGQVLHKRFKARGLEPKIATYRIGMMGYYSRLPVIDRYGLTERAVAHQPLPKRGRPGHEKIAPIEYVLGRGAALGGSAPLRPPPYSGLTEVVIDGAIFNWGFYDRRFADGLVGSPGVRMVNFPKYLDEYVAGRHPKTRARVAADVTFFDSYYFSRNKDPERRAALANLLSHGIPR
jgi:arabinofuranosyltransferase